MVVSVLLARGDVATNQQLLLGPDRVGAFLPVTVRSIEVKRQAAREARAGGAATFALRSLNRRVWRAPARGARDARARGDERG